MAEQKRELEQRQAELNRVRRQLELWRARHGGRGRPIPDELWSAAVEIARADGVELTARALRVDEGRLARRLAKARPGSERTASEAFVELSAGALCAPGSEAALVVRFTGRDGEKLELELRGATAVEALELARAFWSRPV